MSDTDAIQKLLLNSQSDFNETKRILLKIADNIIKNPQNKTVRTLQKSNATVSKKILGAKGGVEFLKLMGFQESNQSFTLPENQQIDKLVVTRTTLSTLQWCKPIEVKVDNENLKEQTLPPLNLLFSNSFLQGIERHFHTAQFYDNEYLQQRAKKLIPIVELELKALNNLRRIQKEIKLKKTPANDVTLQDLLIIELLDWFKNDFFTWVDSPPCEYCSGKTKFSEMSNNNEDFQYTTRVELHKCEICGKITKFPRYHDLNILLETRRGRCGEWANTFTLMCRAMGWDARHIVDEGDHVWTEVYSNGQKRWIHCDPCENAFDTPLMYEIGWKKNLSYVMAYSGEEVQDVTWRYTCNHKEVLKRRNNCSEVELINCLIKLRENRQKDFSQARKKFIINRLLSELVELLVEHKPKNGDYQGRTSGSIDWRLSRGETSEENLYFWEISDKHLEKNSAIIQYSTSLDNYEFKFNTDGVQKLKGWQGGVFSFKNIFRKVENDWKVAYLTRNEGTDQGTITWEVRSTSARKVFNEIHLKFIRQIYENGVVDIKISSGDLCLDFPKSDNILESDLFSGKNVLKITATLRGGKGDVAWQHAQIFRQPLDSTDYPFILKITFRENV